MDLKNDNMAGFLVRSVTRHHEDNEPKKAKVEAGSQVSIYLGGLARNENSWIRVTWQKWKQVKTN